MATTGTRPKPTALKLLDNNPGKRALNKHEAQPPIPSAIPPPPSHLEPEAGQEWRRMIALLLPLGLYTELDRPALTAYCTAWSHHMKAERGLRKYGLTIATQNGGRTMILVALASGCRVAELVGMRAENVYPEHGLIIIKGKGGRERLLWPGSDAMAMLQPYLLACEGEVWRTRKGTPLSVKAAQRNMEHIKARSGVRCHWHRLRVTFANEAYRRGVGIERIRLMLGHRKLETTEHYIGHSVALGVKEEMQALNLAGQYA